MSLIINSNIENVNAPVNSIYNNVIDLNNLQKAMPTQVTGWQSTADTCSYNLNGMANITMSIAESTAPNKIIIKSTGSGNPFEFTLTTNIVALSENTSTFQFVFDGDVNMFMKPMIEKPLTNFFNYLASQIAKQFQ